MEELKGAIQEKRRLRNQVLALLESGVDLEILASESCVTKDELTEFFLPGIEDSKWVPKQFRPIALRRVKNSTKRMIQEANRRMEQTQGSSIKN